MSKVCQVSQKRYNKANKISFSHKANPHRQQPNLQTKRFWLPEENRWVRLKVTTKVIKTISKFGLKHAIACYGASQDLLFQ